MHTLTETVKVRVDAETREQLERHAAETDRSVGAVIRRAVRDYLAAHPGATTKEGH